MARPMVQDHIVLQENRFDVRPVSWLIIVLVLGTSVFCLRMEGRRWWCELGDLSPWASGIDSGHTSQHLVDAYSFTHFLHGLLLYALLSLVPGRIRWDARLALGIALECAWEVIENSGPIIERYRQATIALGYEGDSVLNSVGDIAFSVAGFVVAGRLPARYSIVLFLVIDLSLLAIYRDNFLLNVIMLVYPSEAIKAWQMRL